MKNVNQTTPTFDEYARKVSHTPRLSGGCRTKTNYSTRSDIPLVSIVTVTYNAENTLARTIASVRAQTYKNIEHIIIDGGSTDGTLILIQKNEGNIAYWQSEPDCGIYDAFNKGVALARGKYIGILNADDYYEPDQIDNAIALLVRTGAPFVHGNITMHGWQGRDIIIEGDPGYMSKIVFGMPSLHQVTVLCNTNVFKEYGLFKTNYKIAGDYEWFLRLAKCGIVGAHSSLIHAHMQAGGVSTTRQRRAMWEAGIISWSHGLPASRALRLTLPRVMFPNGHQNFINRIGQLKRQPRIMLAKVGHYAIRTVLGDSRKIPHQVETNSLLRAFLDARQISSNIDPVGLEWLYGLALRSRTHAVCVNRCAETSAIRVMLQAGGSEESLTEASTDVIVCDQNHLKSIDFGKILSRKTVLLLSADLIPDDVKNIPHLHFGAFLAIGAHVAPSFSTRSAL